MLKIGDIFRTNHDSPFRYKLVKVDNKMAYFQAVEDGRTYNHIYDLRLDEIKSCFYFKENNEAEGVDDVET